MQKDNPHIKVVMGTFAPNILNTEEKICPPCIFPSFYSIIPFLQDILPSLKEILTFQDKNGLCILMMPTSLFNSLNDSLGENTKGTIYLYPWREEWRNTIQERRRNNNRL
jgi:hypothetical protein